MICGLAPEELQGCTQFDHHVAFSAKDHSILAAAAMSSYAIVDLILPACNWASGLAMARRESDDT